jgi:RNA recognition motif-containing protein
MQESLNKMVAIVRHGVISPEDASRAIHGCAAMLGLQLAEDIPETTLIVTGMRKSVSRKDVEDAFKKFGEIEGAAVSSNKRGFGE